MLALNDGVCRQEDVERLTSIKVNSGFFAAGYIPWGAAKMSLEEKLMQFQGTASIPFYGS